MHSVATLLNLSSAQRQSELVGEHVDWTIAVPRQVRWCGVSQGQSDISGADVGMGSTYSASRECHDSLL